MMSGRYKQVLWMGFVLLVLLVPRFSKAQAHEATQLILNYEKLNLLKGILENMYEGYTILNKGYSTVKNIAEGNFRLHEAFLNELLRVSPEVRNYYRVVGIIQYQQRILKEYQYTYNRVKNEGVFSVDELVYLGEVYGGLFKSSLRNLDELVLILTAGELRMSDFERLEAIDRLHGEMSALLVSLRGLNSEVNTLYTQRIRLVNERNVVEKLNGLNP